MKIIVNAHKCEIDKTPVNEKEINITKCEFEFAEEITSEFVKEALFTLVGKSGTYKEIIVKNQCKIPSEVLKEKGTIEVGVVAKLVEGTTEIKRYNPRPAYFDTWQGSLKDAENSEPITPSEFDQYEQALQDGLSEVNQKLVDIDEAIEDVNEAITETNNLDLDVSKSGKVATVTLTKKDASTKVVTLSDGTSLMFNWDGTKLGIKTDEDAEYTYVDLQGIQGVPGPKGDAFQIKKTYTSVAEMNADFNNMQLGDYVMIATTVEVEDNAKLYTRGEEQWIFISDFSGATGIRGETGLTPNIQIGTVVSGETPNVTRTGTNENPILNFTLVKGDKGDVGSTGPTGATGNGIASITKTATEGLVDTYTIAYTNGTTSTFNVTNGEDGETPLSDFDALKSDVEDLRDNQIISDEIEGTEINVEGAAKARLYEFEMDKESTQETTTGKQLFDFDNFSYQPANSATVTKNADSYTIQNTTSQWGAVVIMQHELQLKPNTTYTLSAKVIASTSGSSAVFVSPSMSSTGVEIWGTRVGSGQTSYVTFTTASELDDAVYSTCRIGLYPRGVDESATFTDIQIEEGTNVTSWEKFTGGQPAPNPDYPQEVKTVKGYRNLFDKTDTSKQISGYFGGSNGKSILSYPTTTIIYIPTQEGKTYTVTKKYGISSLQRATTTVVPTVATGILSNVAVNLGKSFTYTIPSGANYFLIFVQGSADLNEYTKEEILSGIQIVEGDQELPYVPYGNNYVAVNVSDGINTNNYPIPLNNNEIVGKGTNLDEYIVDKNGKCYLNKVFNKIDSYNGETITTDYWSTTGGLDTGATIYYVRDNPEPIDLQTTVDLKLFKGVNNISNSEDGNMKIRYVESIDSVINEIEDIKTRLIALEGTSL